MNQAAAPQTLSRQIWQDYRNNLPRYLIGLSRYLQSTLMHSLIEERGHAGLGLHFEPYISLAGENGIRLSDLAEALSISKQAVNQTVNQIEKAGYLERRPDPEDGRGKLAVLTERGHQLATDGGEMMGEIERTFADIIGAQDLSRFSGLLARLYRSQHYPVPAVSGQDGVLGWLLPRMSDHVMQNLMELTISRGHPGLKMSYGQVLTLMTPEGGRIQEMARINEVSKQAISSIARELEELGYLLRITDPSDARQVILGFTAEGVRLMEDSIASVDELEQQFTRAIGSEPLEFITRVSGKLYRDLGLQSELKLERDQDIDDLAAQILGMLGTQKSRVLARYLIQSTENAT